MITYQGKRSWGIKAHQRFRRFVDMRENANRVFHVGGKEPPQRKIALVGTADSGKVIDYESEGWECWGVGGIPGWIAIADRWYEVHRLAGESEEFRDFRMALYKEFKGALYMHYPDPSIDNVVNYPVEHITERFGTYFMTSSFSWMMAHAIDELCPEDGKSTPGEIGIFGVDMEHGAEYLKQRSGLRHFIELAKVLGIMVTRLTSAGISYEPIPYPMWQDDPLINKIDKRQLQARENMRRLDKLIPTLESSRLQNLMVISALKHFCLKTKDDPTEEIARLEKENDEFSSALKPMREDLIHWDSVEDEQQWLRDYIDQ